MAANLTSGDAQSYDLGHGQRILQATKPDIVMIQEFNYRSNSPAELESFVHATFPLADGGTFAWHREGASSADIPNGIISRWPILEKGVWEDAASPNREFVWAKVDLPGPNELWVVSVHLLTNDSTRPGEAAALVALIATHLPANDFVLLGGDFNTDSRTEATVATLSQRFITEGPYPVDQNGEARTNAGRSKPYDWVLASRCLHQHRTATTLGASVYPSGLVLDTRVYTPLTELSPAQYGDSAAVGMQHMGVVRDFVIAP